MGSSVDATWYHVRMGAFATTAGSESVARSRAWRDCERSRTLITSR
jgi:hypothetical protein